MEDIPQFLGDLLWNFWTVSIGIVLAIEPVMRSIFPRYDELAARYLTAGHRKTLTWIAAIFAFLMANYVAYHGAKVETRSVIAQNVHADAAMWPTLTSDEEFALRKAVKNIPSENIVVTCASINCKDLADGIAAILQSIPEWKVTTLHGGGIFVVGITGIQINPNEPATVALKDAIEGATKLQVTMGPDTRATIRSEQSYLIVGDKPF